MRRPAILAAALAAVLAGCSSNEQPGNVENACAIFDDRPHWQDAIEDAERKWGAPAHVQMAIIWKESSFRPDAAPPKKYKLGFIPWGRQSSAYGFSQALDGTWDWYVSDTGNRGADREDFDDATDFIGWYMARTKRVNGVPMRDAYNQYLAYHEGHAGYRRGSWRSKQWLQREAAKVNRKAAEYAMHMKNCT